MVVSAGSPVELYLTNKQRFSEVSALADKVAETADFVHPVTVGDLVLAERNGAWTRAKVVEIISSNCFRVDMFDLAVTVEVELNEICKATMELMEIPVLASKCVLHSYYGRESQAEIEQERMRDLMKGLSTVRHRPSHRSALLSLRLWV